ncbi:glycosyltransferase family 4 protein [Secundilactobacillus yichangensis]|uniref:glycosyltransferase family 4 protein n=1 Tax=Secundilactobacillus yichangensis TaxID=2799580 RepID=UPI0019447D2F|nr:glycosyltransferase family 4 protein [Secundilactobacillus yichangensis]
MKLNYLSVSGISDRNAWSGTIFAMSRILSTVYDLRDLQMKFSFFRKILRKFLKKLKLEGLYYGIEERLNRKTIAKFGLSQSDITFAPVGSEWAHLIDFSEGKVIYLSDATYHSMNNYYFFNKSETEVKRKNMNEKETLSRSDKIILASDWAKNDAVNYYHIPEERISVIPFGANIEDKFDYNFFNPEAKEINFLLVGVEWKRKGIDIAIDTVNLLNERSNGNTYRLNIVGVDKPASLSENENIIFWGRLSKTDKQQSKKLIALYKKCDVFILPTRAECAGIVFCEAACYALPTLTYDTGGVKSYVVQGKTGSCLPEGSTSADFADEYIKLMSENRLVQYSRAARERFETRLNWSAWLADFKVVESSIR